MSRSTNGSKGQKSPVKFWIDFGGGTGKYSYWNGTENVSLDTLELVLLDTKGSVTGWHDASSSRIWSNVIGKVKEQELVVKAKGVEVAKGLWDDIKDTVKTSGGNFTTNVYALVKLAGDTYELCCLQLSKSGLREWSEFVANNNRTALYDNVIACSKGDQQKKGSVKYFGPKFELAGPVEDALSQMAVDVDKNVLQPYFNGAPVEAKEESSEVSAPF